MGDDIIIMVDYDNLCRLCLHSTGAMSDIFATYDEISMRDQILCITGLVTMEDDGLPSKICHRCRHIVELSCELRDVVEKSTKILAKLTCGSSVSPDSNNETKRKLIKNHDEHCDRETETVIIETYGKQSIKKVLYDAQDASYDTEILANYIDYAEYNDQDETVEGSYDYQEMSTDINENTAFGDAKEYRDTTELASALVRRKIKKAPSELVCQLCLEQFETKEEVKAHVDTHYESQIQLENYLNLKRPIVCTVCNVQLNKVQLVKHHRKHLGISPYKCKHPGCTYEGTNPDVLRHHRATHGAASRVCEVCGAQFRRPFALRQHVQRVHAPPGHHACAHCGFRARNAPALRVHVRAHHHNPAPRYPCAVGGCGRSFPSARSLAEHAHAHAGERRYRCALCHLASYTSASMLNRHMKLHNSVRVRKCDKCPATFGEYGAFYRHRVAHHGPFHPHKCRACNHGYQSESQLEIHEQKCERVKRLREYEQAQAQAGRTDERTDIQTERAEEHMQPDTEVLLEDKATERPVQVSPENVIELTIDDGDTLAQENVLYIEMEREDSEGEEQMDADD